MHSSKGLNIGRWSVAVLTLSMAIAVLPRSATAISSCVGQLSLTGAALAVTFDGLASTGTTSTVMPNGHCSAEFNSAANRIYRIGTGSDSTGDVYSFGASGSTDRAFGTFATTSLVGSVGLAFVNHSGAPISSVSISFTAEQWRAGVAADQALLFSYQVGVSNIEGQGWTAVPALDAPGLITNGTALNGNDPANQVSVAGNFAVSLPIDSALVVRWVDTDSSGADKGIGIDDLVITTTSGVATPTATYTSTASPTATPTATYTASPTFTPTVTPTQTSGIRPDTPGLYNPANAVWLLRNANSAGSPTYTFSYGPSGSSDLVALTGDWNGDGIDTVGLYVRSTSAWLLSNNNATVTYGFIYGEGNQGLVPIVGDWDGNGSDTIGLYNPANGAWILSNQNASVAPSLVYIYGEFSGAIPFPGDWDGNGTDTAGVYNPANSAFILSNAHNAAPFVAFPYGNNSLLRVKGDYDGNGTDTVGMWNPANGAWLLINQQASVAPELVYLYGETNSMLVPLMGKWPPGGTGGMGGALEVAPTFSP